MMTATAFRHLGLTPPKKPLEPAQLGLLDGE
jgi:hypothetical protein